MPDKQNNLGKCPKCGYEENNPWCEHCKEKDCLVSLDGTCEMIRVYLMAKKLKGKLKQLAERINNDIL